MQSMNRALHLLVIATGVVMALAPRAVPAESGPTERREEPVADRHHVEPYVFQASDGTEVDAELGSFYVPENRARPGSRLVKLSYVRFASIGPTSEPPIVYLAGGPGGSGIGTARERRFPLFMALREVADVIAFDQRGTGLSDPLPPCRADEAFPPERPGNRRELLDHLRRMAS